MKKVAVEEKQIVLETVEVTGEQHLTDHQYMSFGGQASQDEDSERREMDVFDYIGFEIRNIEEREKEMLGKGEIGVLDENKQEIDEEFYIGSGDVIAEENVEETIVIERIEDFEEEQLVEESIAVDDIVQSESDNEDEEQLEELKDQINQSSDDCEELMNYVNVINDSFHCLLCPKIYQKKNITAKHLQREHKIFLTSYNYDNANRYRKPQKELEWKCQFCPKRYTSKRLSERHAQVHGPNGDLVFKCSCCPQYFKEFSEVQTHQSTEHEDRLTCGNCKKQFDHPEKLVSHSRYAHKERKMLTKKYLFMCQLCGKFQSKEYLIYRQTFKDRLYIVSNLILGRT